MPAVSILLPTFNRAAFIPQALASIRSQTWTDWELVVVDDGSTDDSAELIEACRREMAQPVQLIRQQNQGAYAARNRAVDAASGRFVAFFDSDDIWLPEYLSTCVKALESNGDVDWVYVSCRIVDLASQRVVSPDTFINDGAPRPFRRLKTQERGSLRVIDDPDAVSCALRHGFYSGLQNSVMRASVFAPARFRTPYRNEAEDQLFVIRALKRGVRFGYIDAVLVQYHVHDANSSGAATHQTTERQRRLLELVIRGLEDLRHEVALDRRERRVLSRRLQREYFWHLGYSVLWTSGLQDAAMRAYRRGLREWPWSVSCWKTYAAAAVRSWLGRGPSERSGDAQVR